MFTKDNLIDLPEGTVLKPGQRMVRVKDNIWIPVGVGGSSPAASSSVSVIDYYRCASVDTETNTWTGYWITEGQNGYQCSQQITQGLTFYQKAPEKGKIYSKDALIRVSYMYGLIPQNGMLLNFPFDKDYSTLPSGQSVQYIAGSRNYGIQGGIPYLKMDAITAQVTLTDVTPGFSVAFFVKPDSGVQQSSSDFILRYGQLSTHCLFGIQVKNDKFYFSGWNDDMETTIPATDVFMHLAFTFDGTTLKSYCNGAPYQSADKSSLTLPQTNVFQVGGSNMHFKMGQLYAYNRALTQQEVISLCSQYLEPGT